VTEWRWVAAEIAQAIHDEQLATHGGAAGLRDQNALLSALARPSNLAAYGDPDAAELAAAYAFGIARNHPFVDGNKRTAWVVARLFLRKNGFVLRYDEREAVLIVLRLAAGQLPEEQLTGWLRERLVGDA
jgi:death-on-curing protein